MKPDEIVTSLAEEAHRLELMWSLPWYGNAGEESLWTHKALKLLTNLPAGVVEPVLEGLQLSDSFALRGIALHVGRMRGIASTRSFALRTLRDDDDPQARAMAAATVAAPQLDDEVLAALLAVPDDEHHEVKKTVITTLRAARPDAAVPMLTRWAQRSGEDEAVKVAAATALGEVGGEPAVEALIALLGDTSENDAVRSAAAEGLGRNDSARSRAALETAAADERAWVRAGALLSLGRLVGESAAPRLIEATGSAEPWQVRSHATEGLGYAGGPDALAALSDLVTDAEVRVRSEAVASLGRLADTASLPAIRTALDDAELIVRVQAVHAATRITGTSFGLEEQTDGSFLDPTAVMSAIEAARKELS